MPDPDFIELPPGKWIVIEFCSMSKSGKTALYDVFPKGSDSSIGSVGWHAPWRRYAFFPLPGTLYEQDCLRDIADALEGLTGDHRKHRAKASNTSGEM